MAQARENRRDLAESRWSRWDPDLGVNRGAGITATKHRASTGWGIICEREASTYTTCGIVCKRDSRGAEFVGPCILASCILVGWRNGIQEAEEPLKFKCLLYRSACEPVTLDSSTAKGEKDIWGTVNQMCLVHLPPRQTNCILKTVFLQDWRDMKVAGWDGDVSLPNVYICSDVLQPQPLGQIGRWVPCSVTHRYLSRQNAEGRGLPKAPSICSPDALGDCRLDLRPECEIPNQRSSRQQKNNYDNNLAMA